MRDQQPDTGVYVFFFFFFFFLRRGNLQKTPDGLGSVGFTPSTKTPRGTYRLKPLLNLRLVLSPRGIHRKVLLRGGQSCLTGTSPSLAASAASPPILVVGADSSSLFALPDGIQPLDDGRRKGHYRVPARL